MWPAMSTEELSRLKKIRGTHCASVSQLTVQVEKILRQLTDQNTTKLKELNKSLNTKLEAISLLHGKILDSIPEDDLDREVQLADEIR